VSLFGSVADGQTRESLIGATIRIGESHNGTVTDLDGNFKLTGVAPGSYNMSASYPGYATATRSNVIVTSKGDDAINFELRETAREWLICNILYHQRLFPDLPTQPSRLPPNCNYLTVRFTRSVSGWPSRSPGKRQLPCTLFRKHITRLISVRLLFRKAPIWAAGLKTIVYKTFVTDYRKTKRRREIIAAKPPADGWMDRHTVENPAPAALGAEELIGPWTKPRRSIVTAFSGLSTE